MTKECPTCEVLNAEDADTCKHCGTAFFFEPECLQPRLDDPADELVVVGRFASVVDANVVSCLLEANGIDACIPEELTPQIFWNFVTSPIETVTVRVARKDVAAAQRVMAQAQTK